MRQILLFQVVIFINLAIGQNLSPIPTKDGTKFFYKNSSDVLIEKVSVAGSFNNWDKSSHPMLFDSLERVWSKVIKLEIGVEYHYKYVLNDSIWITDPNAPDVTEDEWQNGILIPIEYGKPFVTNLFPPNNKRITQLKTFYCTLNGFDSEIEASSIRVLIDDKVVKSKFNSKSNLLQFYPPKNLSEGEHSVKIYFQDKNGNYNSESHSKFFLDRIKANLITPSFYNCAVAYEIFIRKFFDSNGDGIGDFNGLTEKLDYLIELGVNTLWLMPFNESSTEHGYNVIDYYSIEKDYGEMDDYLKFVRECHRRNIRVIMDFVLNHADSNHPFFVDAYKNPHSKHSKWFQFKDSLNITYNHFGVEKSMPKFNFENDEVRSYFINVVLFWMDPNQDGKFDDGIDGIRCDAAKEVPHSFWNQLRKIIKAKRNDFLILGEVWDNSNYLIPFFEDEFDMLFDYPIYYAFEKFFNQGLSYEIDKIINLQKQIYPSNYQMIRFLSNHDNDRALSKFEMDTTKYFQALTMLFTLPQTPMIYYGDEVGMLGKKPPENVRKWIPWENVNFQKNEILRFYKSLIELRKYNRTLCAKDDSRSKSYKLINSNSEEVFSYLRFNKGKKILVLINNSDNVIHNLKLNNLNFTVGQQLISKDKPFYSKKKVNKILLKKLILLPRDFRVIELIK